MKKMIIFLMITAFTAGIVFSGVEWTTTIKIEGKSKKQGNEIIARTYAQDGNVKQEFTTVSNESMFYAKDSYWLYKANEDNIYIVNDKKKNYMVLNLDALLQMTGMMGSLVKITISDYKISSEALPGESVAGFDCNHVKIVSDYTMKMKITIFKKTIIVHEEKEIWGSDAVPGLKDMHQGFLKKNIKTGFEDLDEMIKKEMEKQKQIGFPLKTVTVQAQLDKKGKVQGETKTTMTVSDFQEKTIPATAFEIPACYEKIEGPADKKGLF